MGRYNPGPVNKKAAYATVQKIFAQLSRPQPKAAAQPSDIPTGPAAPPLVTVVDPVSQFGAGAGPSAPMVPGPSGEAHPAPVAPPPAPPAEGVAKRQPYGPPVLNKPGVD